MTTLAAGNFRIIDASTHSSMHEGKTVWVLYHPAHEHRPTACRHKQLRINLLHSRRPHANCSNSCAEPCSRGGLRILANKTQLQNNIPPSKRPRRDTVLRYLRTQAAAMGHPPPNPEPECLWALPTNLLQVGTAFADGCSRGC